MTCVASQVCSKHQAHGVLVRRSCYQRNQTLLDCAMTQAQSVSSLQEDCHSDPCMTILYLCPNLPVSSH
uniref:Uncharacterized protein n=1 Tax=Arundo donax TaxID=35708 RepID=A0A0A8XVV2_ARUDO